MHRAATPKRRRLAIEALEARQLLAPMLGLTTGNGLVRFDHTRPDLVGSTVQVSGLQVGEDLVAIDSRAQTGQVYGLGRVGTSFRLYAIDPAIGRASVVGGGPLVAAFGGSSFDIDFQGGSNVVRVVSDGGINLRVDADTGAVTVDANLAYAPTDPGAGTTPSVAGLASTGNRASDGSFVTSYVIDSARGVVALLGDPKVFPLDPAGGRLSTNGPLGVPISGPVGFEITPAGQLLASLSPVGDPASKLYTLPVLGGTIGPLQLVGSFPGSARILDITTAPPVHAAFAVTAANHLISFNISTPGNVESDRAILGLRDGEVIAAIAFRPATAALYGFGSTGRLYTINTATAAATPVSIDSIRPAYDGSKPSIDFLPDSDRIRLVTQLGQDLRINPDNGVVVAVDQALNYAAGDPGSGFSPSVVAQVHASGTVRPGFGFDALYGVDSGRDTLVASPGPDTATSGEVATVGPLGLDVTSDAGLDSIDDVTYALLTDSGGPAIYRINPRVNIVPSQRAEPIPLFRIGAIGGSSVVRDLAIAPSGVAQFASPSFAASLAEGSATITVRRTGGISGPLSVTYFSSGGTAEAGVDYVPVRGVLDFAAGETQETFAVPLRPGAFSSGSRTVNLILEDVQSGARLGSAVLTISAPALPPVLTPGVASTTFNGTAAAITSVDVRFNGPVDAARASSPANFVARGVTSSRRSLRVLFAVASAVYDPATLTTRLTLARPIALRDYRSLNVTAIGFGANGTDAAVNDTVQRGIAVSYLDADGDRVGLAVIGRNARVIVVRRADGAAVSAWVEGSGRVVTGLLVPRRGSNRRSVIDTFVNNGASLRLPRSITVTRVPTA